MSNDRRSEIVYATLELAAENGLGTVSMQQIADRIGITKASLYNHFSSRDEIVDEMYKTLRQASKERADIGTVDYDGLASDGTMRDVLLKAVENYRILVRDPQMILFYKIIMSERSIDTNASEIMIKETETMVDATKKLFSALQRKGKAEFENLDSAAFSFAMAVHSIIDYEFDLRFTGTGIGKDLMADFVDEFCRIYSRNGGE